MVQQGRFALEGAQVIKGAKVIYPEAQATACQHVTFIDDLHSLTRKIPRFELTTPLTSWAPATRLPISPRMDRWNDRRCSRNGTCNHCTHTSHMAHGRNLSRPSQYRFCTAHGPVCYTMRLGGSQSREDACGINPAASSLFYASLLSFCRFGLAQSSVQLERGSLLQFWSTLKAQIGARCCGRPL